MRRSGMRVVFFFSVLLAITYFVETGSANAQTVRGRVFRQSPAGTYPAPSVRLTLFAQGRGRSAPVYSGNDGMYFFHGFLPGVYTLEVWLDANRSMNFNLKVLNQPYTDVGPIYIP